MAYSEELAERIRDTAGDRVTEKKMFGGIAFLHNGNMAVGVSGDDLMCRVGPDAYERALNEPGVEEFSKTGRPMTGWVLVSSTNVSEGDDLSAWVETGIDFAATLPSK